jgi:adenosylcobinamide-phosphate synthase
MGLTVAGVVALTVCLEALLAEPPRAVHPVAWFGTVVGRVDRPAGTDVGWRSPRAVGVVAATVLPLTAAAVVGGVVFLTGWVHPFLGAGLASLALYLTTSLGMLVDVARAVVVDSDANTDRARDRALALVGRDRDGLTPAQLRSAAVESAAENLADGLVAPLVGFVIAATVGLVVVDPLALAGVAPSVAPALGASGAAFVKAVNTMDSMLGYPEKAVGTASARLDDTVMWLPARLSAGLLTVAAGAPTALVVARRAGWTSAPPSPNSGWPMATLAAATGVRLEKPASGDGRGYTYVLNPEAPLPSPGRSERAIDAVVRAGVLSYVLAAAVLALVGVWS